MVEPVFVHPDVQVHALGAALARLGFTAQVPRSAAHRRNPCVVVGDGPGRRVKLPGVIYAAPDEGGGWWFWLTAGDDPLGEIRIAPISAVSVTADAVDRTLTRARAVFPQAG